MNIIDLATLANSVVEKNQAVIEPFFNASEYGFDFEKGLTNSYEDTVSYCSVIKILEMTEPKNILDCTIKTNLSLIPRKFGGKGRGDIVDENDLFDHDMHLMILGAPGAGKTTAIKRLVLNNHNIYEREEECKNKFPLLIRLRGLNEEGEFPLLKAIKKLLNIWFSNKIFYKDLKEKIDGKEVIRTIVDEYKNEQAKEVQNKLLISILDRLSITIMLDGLDEVKSSIKKWVISDITYLTDSLKKSRVIISCRLGDRFGSFMRVKELEIAPLSKEDVDEIVTFWLKDKKEEFYKNVEKKGISELFDRPLFLVQLIIIFMNQGYIAEQPNIISEHITLLALKKWQEENSIIRKSIFENFFPEQKMRFLSEFSYELTYSKKSKIFTRRDFNFIYETICENHFLPKEQAEDVASEIESHTGIIQKLGNDSFEFAHLTIQEYLCAKYIALNPFVDQKIIQYFEEYPAPLAIAAAMSMKPSLWLANLLLNIEKSQIVPDGKILILIDRLLLEKVAYEVEIMLALAIAKIINLMEFVTDDNLADEIVDKICSLSNDRMINKSIRNLLSFYNIRKVNNEGVYILNIFDSGEWIANKNNIPREIIMKCSYFESFSKNTNVIIREY